MVDNHSNIINPETDLEGKYENDDDLPLLERSLKLKRDENNNHPTWKQANLVTSDKDLKFLGSTDMPSELEILLIHIYFLYYIHLK